MLRQRQHETPTRRLSHLQLFSSPLKLRRRLPPHRSLRQRSPPLRRRRTVRQTRNLAQPPRMNRRRLRATIAARGRPMQQVLSPASSRLKPLPQSVRLLRPRDSNHRTTKIRAIANPPLRVQSTLPEQNQWIKRRRNQRRRRLWQPKIRRRLNQPAKRPQAQAPARSIAFASSNGLQQRSARRTSKGAKSGCD